MISNVLTRWPAVTAGIGAMLCITALGSLDQAAQPLAWLMVQLWLFYLACLIVHLPNHEILYWDT